MWKTLSLLALASGLMFSQALAPVADFTATIAAGLPAASSYTNKKLLITDGASACDVSTGSGTTRVIAVSNGTSWVAANCGGGSANPGNTITVGSSSGTVALTCTGTNPTTAGTTTKFVVPTLTGAITLTGPTNCTPGQDIQVYLLNGSGAYTQTWGSSYGSDVPTLPAVANAYMLVTLSTPDGTTWHKSSAALISGITAPTTGQIFAQGANNVPVAANATNLTAPQYAAGGGSANAQTVTLSPAIAAYTNGLVVKWLPTAANTTTTPTLAVNGLTATTIVKSPGNVALAASDLTTTAVATAIYDGTYFELQNPQTASGGGAVLYDSYCLVAAGCIYNTNTSIPISGASPIYVKIFIPTAATFNYIGVVVGASSGTEYTAVALYNAGCTTKIAQSAALSITSGVLMLYYSLPTTNLAAGSYVLALSANASNANYYYNTNGAAAMGIYGANSYSWTDTSTATWSGTTPTFPSSCSGTRTFASQFISLLFQ